MEGNDRLVTTYMAKPYETFCQENVSFIFKHLNETVYRSGISTLFSGKEMHNTHYKHVQMVAEKTTEGETIYLKLKWRVSYITQMSKRDKLIAEERLTPPLQ